MKKLSKAPSWLDLSNDRLSFVFVPARAEVIQRIFKEASSGIGAYVIARRLNSEGVKTLGPSPVWIPSSISKILQNRAVLGEYQAISDRSGTRVRKGLPVPNYYPQVIDEALFDEVQLILKSNLLKNRGRKGAEYTNLFSGLLYCGQCNSKMKFENDHKNLSLKCSSFAKCSSFRWDYRGFESDVLQCLGGTQLQILWPALGNVLELGSPLPPSKADLYQARSAFNRNLKTVVSKMMVSHQCALPIVANLETKYEVLGGPAKEIHLAVSFGSQMILLFCGPESEAK